MINLEIQKQIWQNCQKDYHKERSTMWQKILLRVILRFDHSNLITTGIGPVETFITWVSQGRFPVLARSFQPFKTPEWLSSSFSLKYYCWIILYGHENKGNDCWNCHKPARLLALNNNTTHQIKRKRFIGAERAWY